MAAQLTSSRVRAARTESASHESAVFAGDNVLCRMIAYLERFERPWGPEHPVFGHVRYMSSANAGRKFSVSGYIAKYRH